MEATVAATIAAAAIRYGLKPESGGSGVGVGEGVGLGVGVGEGVGTGVGVGEGVGLGVGLTVVSGPSFSVLTR